MGVRTNEVAIDHGDIAAIDGAAALSYVLTTRVIDTSSISGITKGNLFLLYINGSGKFAGGESAVWEKAGGTSAVAGTDYRFGAVYDGGLAAADRFKIWLDGVAETMAGTNPGTTLASSASTLEVGKNTASLVDGHVADLKIWTAALTAAEIVQETLSRRPIRTANLLLWSPYDRADNLQDYSGNGHDGTNASATTEQMRQLDYGGDVIVV